MVMQIETHTNEYIKEWNSESLVEHNLTHHCPDAVRRSIGKVDFRSPFRTLVECESTSQNDSASILEDAEDCAHKLNFLLLAQAASEPTGIHRANSNAGLKIFCAIQYYCEGKSQRAIGRLIEKKHAVADRYIDRFTEWSVSACSSHTRRVRPETVLQLCESHSHSGSVSDSLDLFRRELTDLFHDLIAAASDPANSSTEVYLDMARFQKTRGSFNIPGILSAL